MKWNKHDQPTSCVFAFVNAACSIAFGRREEHRWELPWNLRLRLKMAPLGNTMLYVETSFFIPRIQLLLTSCISIGKLKKLFTNGNFIGPGGIPLGGFAHCTELSRLHVELVIWLMLLPIRMIGSTLLALSRCPALVSFSYENLTATDWVRTK